MASPTNEPRRTRVLSGLRPTGNIHIGHLAGALQNWIELQKKYECYFFIADWHALTTHYADTSRLQQDIAENVKDYLAAGLDPKQATLFLQSSVPEHAELHLLLSLITPLGWLERVPSYKEQRVQIRDKDLGTYGFLGYPVLQSADILMVKGEVVPVGKDQASHVELTREIARRFNSLYGRVFPEPQALVGRVPTLPGTDGMKKMSKSLGNAIFLSDDEKVVERRVMSMFTDPTRIHATDPGHVRGNPVFAYHDAFNPDAAEVNDLKRRYRAGKVGDVEVKRKLARALNEFLEPIRVLRQTFAAEPGLVERIIREGSERARAEAAETLRQMKHAMKFDFWAELSC